MYRQIQVDERDVDFQRIVWQPSPDMNEVHYQLLTLTYGLSCARYLALRVIQQLADAKHHRYPNAADVLRRSTYVDDLFFGADDINSALRLRKEMIELLQCGGFPLRKWVANHPSLISDLPECDRLRPQWKDLMNNHPVRTLGLAWDPNENVYRYKTPKIKESAAATKRAALSVIARLFDPMGWLSPIIIRAKILLQKMWQSKLDWDDDLPSPLRDQWQDFMDLLPSVDQIRIPRWLGTLSTHPFALHGFADASQVAYAAVVYLTATDSRGYQSSTLLISKTRSAVLKLQTIPRLELCAAALLAKLLTRPLNEYGDRVGAVHAWTDSSIVLAWLQQEPSRWPVFVANQVAQIHRDLPQIKWRHVPSEENPADLASRGTDPRSLRREQLWWSGPDWLTQSSESWPANPPDLADLEMNSHLVPAVLVTQETDDDFTQRFSRRQDLLRTVARCLRITWLLQPDKRTRMTLSLSADELDTALIKCIGYVQRSAFSTEIAALKRGRAVGKRSPLRKLQPFLDLHGLLRVGGRLHQA